MAIEANRTNHDLETLRIERPQERPRRKRSWWIAIAMVRVLATSLGAAGYVMYARRIGRPPTVQTMMIVARTDGKSSVLLTGSGYIVTRHKYITIGTKILGQIVDEPIEEGQHIKAGDVLARIDDRDYQAQLRQAIAIRDVAKANLHLLQDKADRARHLIKSGAISTDDFETAITAAEVAQAELERDEAAVDYAKFNVNQCVITSPINGIVLKKYRELGDTINFGGQIQAGGGATEIAQLADTDDMRAEVDINEADIAKVSIGSPVVVALDSYPDNHRRTDTHLRNISLIDVHFGPHIVRVGQLGDVSRASARLNLTAKIDGVPQFPIFLQDNAVDRRSDDALVHIEFGIIDCRLITFKFGLCNFRGGDCCFKVIRRNSARLDQAARPVGFVLKEMKVGFGNVSNGNGLTQLRLIVPIINARQDIASFDVLPLLDGFFHNLSQDFCADGDIFVAGDDITRACQQYAGLAVRPRHYHHRLHCGRPADRLGVNEVADSPENCCKQHHDRN